MSPDAAAPGSVLLDARLLLKLERLQVRTRRRLAGQLNGEHVSKNRGSSVDFADYREYHPGDDFRRIDYHLYARLDVLLVKLFEAEEDLTVRLLVDTSASMGFGGKLEQAKRVAAAFGFVALVRRDPVTLHSFPQRGMPRRFAGREATRDLFAQLASLDASGRTNFVRSAVDLLSRPGPAGLTVVVSDLLTPEWETGLARLPSRGSDLVVVHVLAEDDLRPSERGDYDLVDSEHGGRVGISLAPATIASYERSARDWIDDVAGRCRRSGVSYLRVMADDAIEPLLLGGWLRAGVLR